MRESKKTCTLMEACGSAVPTTKTNVLSTVVEHHLPRARRLRLARVHRLRRFVDSDDGRFLERRRRLLA